MLHANYCGTRRIPNPDKGFRCVPKLGVRNVVFLQYVIMTKVRCPLTEFSLVNQCCLKAENQLDTSNPTSARYLYFRRLRSPNNPPLASADTMLLNPPSLLKSSSSVGGSDTPTPQKKHSSVDNLRLQGTVTVVSWCLYRL